MHSNLLTWLPMTYNRYLFIIILWFDLSDLNIEDEKSNHKITIINIGYMSSGVMWSNFEWIIHSACALKEIPNHILWCTFGFSIFFLHYTDGWIRSIINDCTTAFTLIFCWKMTVIDKCVLCEFKNIYEYTVQMYT